MGTARPHPKPPRQARALAALPADAGTRERLLAAGLDLARREGLKGVSVRAVATAAGVNLGSFVYHFGTRDAFVDAVVERWYAPLMASLQLSAGGADPLREVLFQLARWTATHGRFLALLLRDAAGGEDGARRFLATMDQRHIALLLQLIQQGQQAGRLRVADPALQLMFLMGAVVLPVLMVQGLQGIGPKAFVARITALADDDTALGARLEWALTGLRTAPAL